MMVNAAADPHGCQYPGLLLLVDATQSMINVATQCKLPQRETDMCCAGVAAAECACSRGSLASVPVLRAHHPAAQQRL